MEHEGPIDEVRLNFSGKYLLNNVQGRINDLLYIDPLEN